MTDKTPREVSIQQIEIVAAQVDKLLKEAFEGSNVRFFCGIVPMVDGNRFPEAGEGSACFSANILRTDTRSFLWQLVQVIENAKPGDVSSSFKPTGRLN